MSQIAHLVIVLLQTVPKQKESTQTDQRRLPNDRILGAAGIRNLHQKSKKTGASGFLLCLQIKTYTNRPLMEIWRGNGYGCDI